MDKWEPTFAINRTKLYPPALTTDLVPRSRLLKRLEGWRGKSLSLVCAPAGYGKSTLLSSWVASCECPSAWLSLDERDNDLCTFLVYVAAAVRTIVPGACSDLGKALQSENLPSPGTLADILRTDLDQIGKELILVLDDFHIIREKAVHDLIREWIRPLRGAVHLALGTRHDPPLPLPSMRALNRIVEIRTQDLCFTHEETLAFLQKALDTEIDEELAVAFEGKTEGWVAGLRLIAGTLHHRKNPKEYIAGLMQDHRHIVDFLVEEVLANQPAHIEEFLLDTSILERFCAPLCDALNPSGAQGLEPEKDGKGFIAWAERSNLFLIPLDDESCWFRYHHLFRNLLRAQLRRRKSAKVIANLHSRASDWFAGKGLIEEALHHALQSVDPGRTERLLQEQRHQLMNREEWHRLSGILAMIPAEMVRNSAELQICKAWCDENRHRTKEMVRSITRAKEIVGSLDIHEDDLFIGELNALESAARFYESDVEKSAELASNALDKLPEKAYSVRGFAAVVRSLSLQMMGAMDEVRAFTDAALSGESQEGNSFRNRVTVGLAFARWCEGDLPALMRTAEQLRTMGRNLVLMESIAFGTHFIGVSQYYRNELEAAEKTLRPSFESRQIIQSNTYVHGAFALALTYEARGRHDEADRVTKAVLDRMADMNILPLVHLAEAFEAELAVRRGEVEQARYWASHVTPGPPEPSLRFYIPVLTLAKVHLAEGTAGGCRKAAQLLGHLQKYYEDTHNRRALIECLALRSVVALEQGDEESALSFSERALVCAATGGFLRPFLDLGPRMAGLMDRLVRRKKADRYAGRILAAFRDEGSAAVPADRTPGGDMSRRELEILTLMERNLSNKEIATELFISPETVKRHTANIYQKLHVNRRREAVARARSLGYLSDKQPSTRE